MSRIYMIAIGAALCAGAAATTNAQATTPAATSDTTVAAKQHERRPMRHRPMQRGAMQRADRALFKGIDLSSAQKAQLDSVRSRYRSESRSLREQMAPEMKNARAARQSGDSAKIAEVRQSMAASREKMTNLHKQEMSEIRGVLTPEQQSTFDSNVKTMQDRMQRARDTRRDRRAGSPSGTSGQ